MPNDIAPEELSEESRLMFFASYTLERLRLRGLVKTPRGPLLTPKEFVFTQDMIRKNLCTFEDADLEAALLYCAAGAGIDATQAEILKAVRTMVAEA
jgi:hypothetical protein